MARSSILVRRAHPGWGKRKLTVLLQREGDAVSESTLCRMISESFRRGRIACSPRRAKRRRASRSCLWATRGWSGLDPVIGKGMQIDTMTVTPHYGFRFKPFTTVDVASRYRVGELYVRATASCAARFLGQVRSRLPARVLRGHGEGGRPEDGATDNRLQPHESLGPNTLMQYIGAQSSSRARSHIS